MRQSWRELLFTHWPMAAQAMRPLLPAALTLDTFEREAWVGIVPFQMREVCPRGIPALPWFSESPELNVPAFTFPHLPAPRLLPRRGSLSSSSIIESVTSLRKSRFAVIVLSAIRSALRPNVQFGISSSNPEPSTNWPPSEITPCLSTSVAKPFSSSRDPLIGRVCRLSKWSCLLSFVYRTVNTAHMQTVCTRSRRLSRGYGISAIGADYRDN